MFTQNGYKVCLLVFVVVAVGQLEVMRRDSSSSRPVEMLGMCYCNDREIGTRFECDIQCSDRKL